MLSLSEKEYVYEGHYSRRRFRHTALSADKGSFQAAAPGLRQAHDLLSPVHADAGRHPGYSDYFHPHRHPPVSGSAGRRQPLRHPSVLRRAALSGWACPGISDWRRLYRGRALRHDSGRQYFLRQRFLRNSRKSPGQRGAGPCHSIRLLCSRPETVWRNRI